MLEDSCRRIVVGYSPWAGESPRTHNLKEGISKNDGHRNSESTDKVSYNIYHYMYVSRVSFGNPKASGKMVSAKMV